MGEIPSLLYLKQVVCFQNNNIARDPALLTLNLLEDFWDFPNSSFSELMRNNGAFVAAWRLIKLRHLSCNLRRLFEENHHYFCAERATRQMLCHLLFHLWKIKVLMAYNPIAPFPTPLTELHTDYFREFWQGNIKTLHTHIHTHTEQPQRE